MTWAVTGGVVAAVVAGLVAGLWLSRVIPAADRPGGGSRAIGRAGFRFGKGRKTIAEDVQSGIGRRAIDSLRAGVVVLDAEDVPVLVNPAARAMGLLRTGGRPGSIIAHPLVRTLAGQVRRTGVRREIQLDLPRGRDSIGENPLGVHLRAMGLGSGFIAVEAVDVTEAHRLARVRRDFVANVSHELKTPIGALQLLAEALLDATGPTDEERPELSGDLVAARRFAERIQHESTRLGRLVQELLELTRLQGAEPQPAPEPVAVDWVISEVVDRTRTAAAARRIDVTVEAERGLTVYGSDSQLATAVANLVENAINYSGVETTVRVTARSAEEHVEIAVTDQGIGIAPGEVDRIFERFYRADQARSRATGGTGLGLAIVKHIASNHGGRVDVTSTLGGGSTFTLRLPARPPDDLLATLPSGGIEAGPAGLYPV
ncbi:ATP-binding protein [Micromonospora qiuiae]|uniref:ATP-binding protein n=1 Tax=Micromonospora qiuiae TaxID=502268 RepID=UPI003556A104